MVGIRASADSTTITIFGHGLSVPGDFELAPNIILRSVIPPLDLDSTVGGCASFVDYAATIHGHEIASFTLVISDDQGAKSLATKAWNALWLFHLLSVACRSPTLLLFAQCDGSEPQFSSVTRTPIIGGLPNLHPATADQLTWARDHMVAFAEVAKVPEFGSAMRCFGNAHYLLDLDMRIMLLWSGIEGLLSVDAELSRRIALYAALLMECSPEDKAQYFKRVKDAYAIRSRAVHGGKTNPAKLQDGYDSATRILADLLARCVEIGRVPTPGELDRVAVTGSIS